MTATREDAYTRAPMTSRRSTLALLVLAAIGGAPSLRAQSLPVGRSALEPPDLGRFLRWGPLRVRPGFQVPGIGYDDNILYRAGDNPKVGDAYITLSPRADGVVLLGKSAFATFAGRYDYTAYQDYNEINYSNSFLATRVTLPFRDLGVYVEAGRDRIEDRPVDLLDARPVRRESRAAAGLIVKLGWRTEAEIGLTDSRWRATDPNYLSCRGSGGTEPCFEIGDLLDREETGRRLQVKYLALGRTRITLTAATKDFDFVNDDPTIARDARERRILPGVEIGPGGPLSGLLRLGWARLDLDRTPVVDFSGMVGEAQAAWRGGGGTTLRLTGRRDVAFSIYEDNNVYVRGTLEARAVKYFNRMFGAEVAASTGRLRFPQGDRTDRQSSVEAGTRIRFSENDLGRRVEYSLKWIRYRIDSTRDSLDQSRSILAFGASFGY